MKSVTRVFMVDDNNEKFFGEGPYRLLKAIQKTGSLRSAAISMNMAYTKALKLIATAESALGFPLTKKVTGGRSGGGSSLTEEGEKWLARYEAYRNECFEVNRKLFDKYFSVSPKTTVGCVIMASGLGQRFGSNKLIADFHGQPLIQRAIDVSADLFAARVVVTRHEAIRDLCDQQKTCCVLHDKPYRSDTIALGIHALLEDASAPQLDGCIFMLGDQPLLRRESLQKLLDAIHSDPSRIWRMSCNGKPGNPVYFPAWTFAEMMQLPPDEGGAVVIRKYLDKVSSISIENELEFYDVDTVNDIEFLKGLPH